MKSNPGPGKLIALEGLDGAGTTTQAGFLADWLRRYQRGYAPRVHVTREPSQGPVGAQIRSVLDHRLEMDPFPLAALFAADRIDHLHHDDNGVVARLEEGGWVVMDRYYLSSFAYQALTLDQEGLRWLWHLHEPCLIPDMTFFLDVPVAVCLERIALNRGFHFELFETQDTLQKVRERYLDNIERFRRLGHNIQIVEGLLPAQEITKIIRDRLQVLWETTRLPPDEYNRFWKSWPFLGRIRQRVEKELDLQLLTINRLPSGRKNRGGYKLVFSSRGSTKYYVMAYHSAEGLNIFPSGSEDDTKKAIKEVIQASSRGFWDRGG